MIWGRAIIAHHVSLIVGGGFHYLISYQRILLHPISERFTVDKLGLNISESQGPVSVNRKSQTVNLEHCSYQYQDQIIFIRRIDPHQRLVEPYFKIRVHALIPINSSK